MAPRAGARAAGVGHRLCAGLRLVVLSTVAGSVIAAALGLGALALYRWAQHAAQAPSAVVAP